MNQLNQEAHAAASIVQLFLAMPDLDHDGLLQLLSAHRRLNRLLDQIVPNSEDLLPHVGPSTFSLVSSQERPRAGHLPLATGLHYCRGCGFIFDPNRPLEAAQHKAH